MLIQGIEFHDATDKLAVLLMSWKCPTCRGFLFDDNRYLRQYRTDTNETTTLGNMFPATTCSGAAWPAYTKTSYLDRALSLRASNGTSVFVVEPSLHVMTLATAES